MNNNYENLPAVLNANQLATALGAAVRACTHRQYSNF